MQRLKQLLIGKPYEIVEFHRNKLRIVFDLKLYLGPLGRVLEAVTNVGEGSAVSEYLGGALEVIFVNEFTDFQSSGGHKIGGSVSLGAGYFNLDQFVGGSGKLFSS